MGKVIGILLIICLLVILLFPSVHINKEAQYDDSEYGYGEITYFNWSYGCESLFYGMDIDGNIYFLYFGNNAGKFWKYEKILDAPEIMGDFDYTEAYLSNSVAYVGDIRGRIYYADPETGDLINIIDLSRLHIYFNATNEPNAFFDYHILWGDKKGYFYLFFNNTIYYIYRDISIISKYHYNFSGILISSYYWNGGFVLKFGESPKPWLHSGYRYSIYYVKDGEILWNLTLPSIMFYWQRYAPDIYIYQDYVYHFENNKISVYKDGENIKNFDVEGNVVRVRKMGNELFVFTYFTTKNLLLVYDENYTLVKKVMLFDMKDLGITGYDVRNQKVSIYENSTEYGIFLYTCSYSDRMPYLPLRIVYLDKNLNVTYRNWCKKFYHSIAVYPFRSRDEVILVTSEFHNLYFAKIDTQFVVNPFAWLDLKAYLIIFYTLFVAYVATADTPHRRRIRKLKTEIKKHGMKNCVTPEEIITYLNADTYENDKYKIDSILENEYLILHEILEIYCLKKKGLKITENVIVNNWSEVYDCHLNAIDGELEYAKKMNDEMWIKNRVKDLESYLEDPFLPEKLREKVMKLIEKWKN